MKNLILDYGSCDIDLDTWLFYQATYKNNVYYDYIKVSINPDTEYFLVTCITDDKVMFEDYVTVSFK